MDNRNEIREFLASRRAKVIPEQVGLPDFGGIRRVPGLNERARHCDEKTPQIGAGELGAPLAHELAGTGIHEVTALHTGKHS